MKIKRLSLKNEEIIREIYNELKETRKIVSDESQKKINEIINIKEYMENIKIELENHRKNFEECDRRFDLKETKQFSDYDRIILEDLESRISILEEEKEIYNKM